MAENSNELIVMELRSDPISAPSEDWTVPSISLLCCGESGFARTSSEYCVSSLL